MFAKDAPPQEGPVTVDNGERLSPEVEHLGECHSVDVFLAAPLASSAGTEMPLERTWFTLNWLSDFFKDLTEETSTVNLHEQTIEALDSHPSARNTRIQVSDEDISCFHNRIAQLEHQLLPADFTLPSKNKVNRYLTAFFGYFIPHAPIIHPQCFEFQTFSGTSDPGQSKRSSRVVIHSIRWSALCE